MGHLGGLTFAETALDRVRATLKGGREERFRHLDAERLGGLDRRAGHSEGRDLTAVVTGHRHGSRVRTLTGTFGKTEIAVPRGRLNGSGGKTTEWKSHVLRNYQHRTRAADALIAGAYLAGTNTRRVRRAFRSVFGGEVGKDTVSRVWRKVKGWPTSQSCG
jgi:transposase-like protein